MQGCLLMPRALNVRSQVPAERASPSSLKASRCPVAVDAGERERDSFFDLGGFCPGWRWRGLNCITIRAEAIRGAPNRSPVLPHSGCTESKSRSASFLFTSTGSRSIREDVCVALPVAERDASVGKLMDS
eukprot:384371-Rhodomonas_salina.1